MENGAPSKNFLEEIQSMSEANKKRVLVVGTIIIMVIVIGVWFSYFNNIIAQGGAQLTAADQTASAAATVTPIAVPATTQATAPAPSGPTVWQNIEGGFAWIGNIFKRPSNYSIQPQGN